jgi:hypothetical protein
MKTDIGSLAAGLDGHGLGIGIGLKGYEKQGPAIFLGALTFL